MLVTVNVGSIEKMVRPEGFEPPTIRLEGGCSIRLKQARYQTALYPDIKTLRPAKSASLRGRILLTALLTVNVESAAWSGTFLSSARLPLLLQTPRLL